MSNPVKKYLSLDEDDLSLEKLLQDKSKHGVFEADFENQNGTTVTVRDGDSVVLGCRVYLLHDKTVSTLHIHFFPKDFLFKYERTYAIFAYKVSNLVLLCGSA